jgi:secreted Zn-dependent insulinase-like peptidase
MGSWNSKVLPIALQYLNFLGTPTMSAEEISKEYYKLASNFGANFTDHHINLSLSGLNENFDRTVSIFEQLITQAKADPATFELLKGRLIKQRNDAKANKGAILQGLAQYAQFGAKNPRTALNFTNDELKALTVDEVVNFLKDLFNFKHTVIYYGQNRWNNSVLIFQKCINSLHNSKQTYHWLPILIALRLQKHKYCLQTLTWYKLKSTGFVQL